MHERVERLISELIYYVAHTMQTLLAHVQFQNRQAVWEAATICTRPL